MSDRTETVAPLSESEIEELFKRNCVDHPGNFEVTPGQAIKIVRAVERRSGLTPDEGDEEIIVLRFTDDKGSTYDHEHMGEAFLLNVLDKLPNWKRVEVLKMTRREYRSTPATAEAAAFFEGL